VQDTRGNNSEKHRMWKSIAGAPHNGSIVWVGNSQTGEMRLARWQTHQLIRKEGWFDLLL
jgi:hypothetical protein